MNSPKVSIIVCTYNQEDTLSQSLDSVLAQEVDFTYEIILADDCSHDSTPQICKDYAKRYPDKVRLVLNEHNKGVVDNYFDCIMMCRGEYIADLAGDDLWIDRQKLAKQVRVLDADSSIVLCHANWQYLNSKNEVLPHFPIKHSEQAYTIDGREILTSLMRHDKEYFIQLCTSLYRRDCAQKVVSENASLFRDKRWICEDFQLEVYLAMQGKIAYLPDYVLHYRVGHPTISSTEDSAKVANVALSMIELTHAIAKDLGISEAELQSYYQYDLQYALIHAVYAERKDLRDNTLKAWRELGVKKSLKNKLTEIVSSNKLLWKSAVLLHTLF